MSSSSASTAEIVRAIVNALLTGRPPLAWRLGTTRTLRASSLHSSSSLHSMRRCLGAEGSRDAISSSVRRPLLVKIARGYGRGGGNARNLRVREATDGELLAIRAPHAHSRHPARRRRRDSGLDVPGGEPPESSYFDRAPRCSRGVGDGGARAVRGHPIVGSDGSDRRTIATPGAVTDSLERTFGNDINPCSSPR